MTLRRMDVYTPQMLSESMESPIESNASFFHDDVFTLEAMHVEMPTGRGRITIRDLQGLATRPYTEAKPRSFAIIQPPEAYNAFGGCLPYAIVIGMKFIDNPDSVFCYAESQDLNRFTPKPAD